MVAKYPAAHDAAPGHATQIEAQDARQAMKTGYMRRVLAVSVVLAVLAMAAAFWAFHRSAPEPVAKVSAPQAPLLQRDQAPASTPPTNAAPQSSQPLP